MCVNANRNITFMLYSCTGIKKSFHKYFLIIQNVFNTGQLSRIKTKRNKC